MTTPSVPIVTTSPDSARAAALKSQQQRAAEVGTFGEIIRQTQEKTAAKKKAAEEEKKKKNNNKNKNKNINNKNKEVKPLKLPKDYKWNLPPHQWSLPVTPKSMEPDLYEETGKWGSTNPIGDVPDKYRRGRLWWYYNTNATYNTATEKDKKQITGPDRRIGFQFMWNPDTFSTSVALNTEVTPHPADIFASVAGAFPSGETLSLQLRLDRTNDFACMRHLLKKDYNLSLASPSKDIAIFERMADYYKTGFASGSTAQETATKIRDLMEYGTVADLEYLYKAVNGPNWTSITGRDTGDIGYLSATLLRVDIGPLSYVGYINNLNVNHIAFAQDMTPIRTDVSIAMNLMASAGIASKNVAAAVAP
jgi:hypothetical protein